MRNRKGYPPTVEEQKRLIIASFERNPCGTCFLKMSDGVLTSNDGRCRSCGDSLRQRWQVQRAVENQLNDPRFMLKMREALRGFKVTYEEETVP